MAKEAENIFERNWADASISKGEDSKEVRINKYSIRLITGIGLFCFGLRMLWVQFINQEATPLWIFNTYWKEIVIWVIALLLFAIIGTIKSDKLVRKYQRERIAKK